MNRILNISTSLFSFLRKVGLIVLCTLYSALSFSQNFPVQVIPQALPPAPIYVFNYADASTVSSPLRVQIILNDFEIANREIRLKTYFTGSGLSFQSNDIVVGASPLFLEGGIPLILTNVELAPYFEFNNITGINASQYGNAIPEGAYQFCVEVYDVLTGSRLSNKSCAVSVVFQNEPPFLVMPRNKINVDETNPQYIVFQWTPRSINVSNVEYELSLVEIWDTQVDPQQAFLSSPPVFQTTTTATTYVYGPSDPLLLSGKNYAWRIQAKAKQGIEEIGLFKNQGYSEIFSFSYAGACDLPLVINHEVKGSTNANIFWDDFSTEIPEFTIRYRQKNVQDAEWFLGKTTTNDHTIWDLKAGTTYEYQLSKNCGITQSDWSYTKEFTTALEFEEESILDCGVSPDINLTNMQPLASIGSGATFKAGDFPVKILEVSGANGRFTGKGYVTLPYLKNIKVAVEFANILINTDQEMAEGSVRTAYDADWGNILDTGDVVDQVGDFIDAVGDFVGGLYDIISDLFETNEAINEIYEDGVVSENELPALENQLDNLEKSVKELETISPKTAEEEQILNALKDNATKVEETIENTKNGNNTVTSDAIQAQEKLGNLTQIKIYFDDKSKEYEVPSESAFPTISGVPIRIADVEKLGISEVGGLEWFIVDGEKYLGAFSETRFRGYYKKATLVGLQKSKGELIISTKEIEETLAAAEYTNFSIADVGGKVYTLAKRVEQGVTYDCICEYTWTVTQKRESVVYKKLDSFIPPNNATRNNCSGVSCDTQITLGLGSAAYDAIIEEHPGIKTDTKKLKELEELKDYLDGLTNGKTFALYNTDDLKDIGPNNYSEYRKFFKKNYIYNKTIFLEYFPGVNYARDVEVIFTRVDLRKGIVEGSYNQKSKDYTARGGKYEYSFADITNRHFILEVYNDNTSISRVILENESLGIAQPISTNDFYKQYVAKWGTDSAWIFIAKWSAVYAEDLIEGYGASTVTVKASKLFGTGVKTPSLWKKFIGLFKKPQKVKNRATTIFSNNARVKQLVNKLSDNPTFTGAYDESSFKFYLPNKTGDEMIDVIDIGFDGRITIKDGNSINGLLDEFNEIKIDFSEGSNIRIGNQSYVNGSLNVDNNGVIKFEGDIARGANDLLDDIYEAQKNLINKYKITIKNASNNAKGVFGEVATDVKFTENGFESLHIRNGQNETLIDGDWGGNGIDHVFLKDGKYYIVESKYGSSELSKSVSDGPQMSDSWIEGSDRILNVVNDEIKALEILDSNYTRILSKISDDGTVLLKELDEFGKEIGDFIF